MDGFFFTGEARDIKYTNIRDVARFEEARQFIADLWGRYKKFADPHFREDAKNHFLERFWEMYLAVTLIEHGFNITRVGEEGPEFYIEQDGKRIWVEAIAPGPGEGPDRVPEPECGVAYRVPTEKILLRFTHALSEKRNKYIEGCNKGIISPDDGYLLAINSRGIPHARLGNSILENRMPYFIQACFPVGPPVVSIDPGTGNIVDSSYQYRPAVQKLNGANISTTAFLDKEFSCISSVLHSSVDCVNRPETLGGDFCMLHNPNASLGVDQSLFSWCQQLSLVGDELITRGPN